LPQQTISENEDERSNHREADIMGIIICARRVSKCVEGILVLSSYDYIQGLEETDNYSEYTQVLRIESSIMI